MCTPKSISEIAALLRQKITDQDYLLGPNGVSPSTEVLILLVEGFEGELGLIEQATRTRLPQFEHPSHWKGGGPIEMQFDCEPEATSRVTFLLLDLRHRRHGERGLLESIGGIPTPSEFLPHVILVSSIEEFHDWRGIEATHCWQLRGSPSPAELATALRAFLHLCAILANRPPDERPALDNFDKYALKGKTNKE
jgi:hypothetical protein